MDSINRGIGFIFSSYKRTAAFLIIGALALSIPVTLSFLSNRQDVRQRASEVCSSVAADIVLVIDKSTSMNDRTSSTDQTTLISKAKQAASQFVDTVAQNNQNKIGLVSYSSQTNTTTDSALSSDFSGTKTKINAINANGETCTQCGIKNANQEITAHKRSGFKNAVILLTDGRANSYIGGTGFNNTTQAEAAALQEAKNGAQANGTVYFTIGLGSQVNASFLQQIATTTGGKYFYAPTANDLASIYQQISQIVGKGSLSGYVYNDVNGNGVQDTNEEKLSGWNIQTFLQDPNQPAAATGTGNATTDSTGGFSVTGLCDGLYTIKADLKTGWTFVQPQGDGYKNIAITNGANITDKNFGVTQTSNITPTAGPTATPTATITPQNTTVSLDLSLIGIGAPSSDSARLGINSSPQRPTRLVQVQIYNAQNQLVASNSGNVAFNSTTGTYKGTIDLGSNFQTGNYLIKTRMDNTLFKTSAGIVSITAGATNAAPSTQLVSGDVNHDNVINLLDYNQFITCIQNKSACVGNEMN
ncbi:MAG TPA: VWA domain-containing protein [Patescibacteria group bacterium]|nr:VWA domain-containing protein [Patescibacteria group bacterium]